MTRTGPAPLSMGHLFALLFGTIVGVGWIAATGSWIG